MKRSQLGAALIAVYFTVVLGCSQNGPAVKPVDTVRPQAGSDPTRSRGTVDGGGGAGYKGKPLESYKKDITTFPEYKKFVEPTLKSVGKIQPEFEKMFLHIVKNRLWLFIDEPVPKISSERQGLPYNMDQWAVQNSKEIWMSNEYKGDEENRARILLHEIFVGLKIMRFLSAFEYCSVITAHPDFCKGEMNEATVQNPKLNDHDHQDVRNLTDWLMAHHATMTPNQFSDKMHQHQFHSEHYSWRTLSIRDPLNVETHFQNLLGRPVKLFSQHGIDRLAKNRCEFEVRRVHGGEVDLRIQFRDLQGGQVIRTLDLSLKTGGEFKAWPSGEARRRYTINLNEGLQATKVGDRQKYVSVEFDHDRITEIFGGESVVAEITNGAASWRSSNDGPSGVTCRRSYIDLPNNFERLQEMREPDREIFERKRYSGKTLREFYAEALRNLPPVLKAEGWTGN